MSWSRVNTKYSIHQVQHTPSTAYSEYCIHCILHTPRTCIIPKSTVLPLPASLSSLGIPCCTQFSTFRQSQVNQWIESQLQSRLPPELPAPDWPPPSSPSISLDHGFQVHSKLAPSQPPSVSLNLHDYGIQGRTITASKCIVKLARSQPPSVCPNSLDHRLGVHLSVHSIMVWWNDGDNPSSTLRRTSHGIRWEILWEWAVLARGA